MKVGVLGSGDVGQVLGAGFVALGHEVMMGTRDPKGDKVRAWVAKTGGRSAAGTFAEAAGERVQRWLLSSRVVKAYNTVGNPHMINPQFQGGPPDMFLCGNDDDAKKQVAEICRAFGWPTVDLGGIEASRYLEPLAMVWIWHYIRTKSGNHAFKLLRK
jgi:predicted dinucleotide-binding enzyme